MIIARIDDKLMRALEAALAALPARATKQADLLENDGQDGEAAFRHANDELCRVLRAVHAADEAVREARRMHRWWKLSGLTEHHYLISEGSAAYERGAAAEGADPD